MIFGGPEGSGKKARVLSCLYEIYGNDVYKTKIQHRQYKLPSKKLIEITTVISNYHIEINVSEAKQGNRVIIQEIVDEITGSNNYFGQIPLKFIILTCAEHLNRSTQHSLRRTMERYSSSCRFVLLTTTFTQIIEPIQSRCFNIRVEAPNIREIVEILQNINQKESINLSNEIIENIARSSDQNLETAIMTLQGTSLDICRNDWRKYTELVVESILTNQTPTNIVCIRGNIYELMGKCISTTLIFKRLVFELLKRLDSSVKTQIVHWAAHYEHAMKLGGKPIMHIEAFIVKCMEIYKKFMSNIYTTTFFLEN